MAVAPHAGALVETDIRIADIVDANVAPHAGALVETTDGVAKRGGEFVAPHAGALVETARYIVLLTLPKSRLTQAR